MWSCDQSLATLAFLRETLSKPQFYKDLTKKTAFFEAWPWFKFNNLGLALVMALKFLHQSGERVKTKTHKVLLANFYVCRGWGGFLTPTILNRVKLM